MHRPRYHYTAPRHWLNDPNGICHHGGRYHLYYQHNPHAAQWGHMHWGHASSADLLHWRDEPIALAPGTGDDEGGCFSGSYALVDGQPTLYYTGYTPARQVQCTAVSHDLQRWTRQPDRTIIEPPPGVSPHDFRDPYVLRHGGHWYLVVGASIGRQRGAALLYHSEDGIGWTYRGRLFESPREGLGAMWECPNLFPLGDRWVLLVSVWPNLGVHAFVGDFDGERFVAHSDAPVDTDGGAFAPLTMIAPDGRRLHWAWLNEQREAARMQAEGWAGAMSVPREWRLGPEGRLGLRPVAELEALRTRQLAHAQYGPATGVLARFEGTVLDIEARFTARSAERLGLVLRESPCGRERTRIVYHAEAQRLSIERERSSLDPGVSHQNLHAVLMLADDEPLQLRVLLDASVLEVYANDRICLSTRLYPTLPESAHGHAFSDAGAAVTLQAWAMAAITDRDAP